MKETLTGIDATSPLDKNDDITFGIYRRQDGTTSNWKQSSAAQ